jgi:pyrroloquinoline quinone (PQQ) biosynthesis protein C
MPTASLSAAISEAVADRLLLRHSYYRAWQDGALTTGDIASYAAQYRYFERLLPEALAAVAASLEEATPRRLVEENLADERSRPAPHVELFEQFASSVGATLEPSSPDTRRLVDVYRDSAAVGPIEGLAVIAAYETQAAEVAATKAEALRRHYCLDLDGTRFWDVHAELESSHAAWTIDALSQLGASPDVVKFWASRSASAWWDFLDARNAAVAAARC